MRKAWMPVVLPLVLAGCGGSETTGSGAAPGAGEAAAAEVAATWATDACKTLSAEAAGKAAGLAVTKTVEGANASTNGVNVSSCTYSTEDGVMFTIGLRHDTMGAATMPEMIAGLTARPDVTGPVEEVPSKNGRAFWTPRLKTLSYLPDDTRTITVTPPYAKPMGGPAEPKDDDAAAAAEEATLKAKALAMAEAAAG